MNWKNFDVTILEDRVLETLDMNEESSITGVASVLLRTIERCSEISIELIFDFAERYSVSIDWLVGRTNNDCML